MSSSEQSLGRREAIPVLYTRGSHYDVGYDIGRTFRGLIEDFLKNFTFLHQELLPAYTTQRGRQAYDATLGLLRGTYPHYLRELEGTAAGARVPFLHLMLLHVGRQMLGGGAPTQTSSKPPHGCSTVCSNYPGRPLLGHTEDALNEVMNHIYIVSAHITEDQTTSPGQARSERFTSLCYAGYLPGFCMSCNQHGLVFSVNVLFPTHVHVAKTPPYFLTRALLAAQTLQEAEDVLKDQGAGAGDGFSVNMAFTRQEGNILFHNAEVAPPLPGQNESQLSILTINTGEHFMHANKYLRLSVPEDLEYEDASSSHRHARAQACPEPDCRAALLELLSDTQDAEYPIFREGQEGVSTVTLGIFDIREGTWSLYMKNPRTSSLLVSLPINLE
ncbi:uncharacterized protein LOC108665674 isoform X2 [Hyalella azteca]|uniref:Uncharacterized protein LOC108665674 isoform X2 n=1 Tax=Hyalella azteca TaxID=294128 RepID=A0A979FSQ9_HYAAZ|nr:uncharacterized protein LOC108665674 isoform X2 [Hyalella azteca]